MNIIRKWWQLPSKDRRLVLEMLWLMAIIRIGLKLFPFLTVQEKLDNRAEKKPISNALHSDISQTRKAIDMVGLRLLKDGPCLSQAWAMRYMLKRWSLPVKLCIGIAKGEGDRFLAHAWIEINGQIMIGGSEEEVGVYSRVVTFE